MKAKDGWIIMAGWICLCLGVLGAAETKTVLVPSHLPWVDSGLEVHQGQTLTLKAEGLILYRQPHDKVSRLDCQCGPSGTYHFSDELIGQPFPLPAAGSGPAPCFALIGKIGPQGEPFYIGDQLSVVAKNSGRLILGINDCRHDDNQGSLTVHLQLGGGLEPVAMRWQVLPGVSSAKPKPGCSVVIFYIDGLRPDVVREMAAMGHLPNFQEIFLTGGTQLENAYTVFPSDTITSNGSLWTGCFSDRHGIKCQIGFNRHTGVVENYLGKLGPTWNDELLAPHGADRAWLEGRSRIVKATRGEDAAQRFREERTSGTPALYHHLAKNGRSYSAGVLPIMTDLSPALWTRYITDEAPYLGTQKADRYIDEANTAYAVEQMLRSKDDVMIVWLPENDTVSHHEYRGQFGMARRSLAEVDRMLGEVVGHLRRQKRLEKTYLMVVSDHGHIGGRFQHLHRYDIANEFFHRPREIDSKGNWFGGGLGLSVKQYRYENRTQGDRSQEFVYLDALGDGVARISLPRGTYYSGDWSGPNPLATLMQYRVSPKHPPVDLLQALLNIEACDLPTGPESPIDLVLAKIDERSLVVAHRDRGWAVIDRLKRQDGRYVYRYRVIENVVPCAEGGITYQEVEQPQTDPLLLVGEVPPSDWGTYLDERLWLQLSHPTPYPDGLVTMARHLLWQPHLSVREAAYAPDLVVTCRPNWQFNTFNEPGTAHGHPFRETMNMSFFVAGPGVHQGATISQPVRSVDLMPTVLEMVGVPYDPQQLDGQPLLCLFADDSTPGQLVAEPVVWQDIDLGGWHALPFQPRHIYPIQPRTVDRPQSFWDLNNVVYNALSLSEISVNRILDDSARLMGRKRGPVRQAYREAEIRWENIGRWRNQSGQGLYLNKIAIGDYSWYSVGNLQRISNVIDWTQYGAERLDHRLSDPLGARTVLGTSFTNPVIDAAQYSAFEVRRFGTKAAVHLLDEWFLNGLENTADHFLNARRQEPAEVQSGRHNANCRRQHLVYSYQFTVISKKVSYEISRWKRLHFYFSEN